MWIDRDTYNFQAAADFEDETPDPFQPARDALQFARDTAGAWQPAQWAQDAADFARSTAPGMGDVQRSGQPEQPTEPTPDDVGDLLGNAGQSIGGAAGAVGQAIGSGLQTARNAIPTTVELGVNPQSAAPTGNEGNLLQRIGAIATQYGLDPNVAKAIGITEGGLDGAVGDNGQSFGIFQFYKGGQLANFAKSLGVDLATAGKYATDNPEFAADWALRPGGYLGDAIRRGVEKGLSGSDLATYAQRTGQVSVSPERAGQNYARAAGTGDGRGVGQPDQGRAPYSFPVAGYSGKDVPLHWGSNSGGTDLFAAEGTPVVAMRGGKVISASTDSIGGNAVLIQGDDGNQYYYAHLYQAPAVKAGQVVGAGDYLGGVGDTGNAKGTGAHLHMGIGPSIVNGAGPQGGTGGDFNAVGLLRNVLAGGVPAIGDALGNAGRAVGNAWDQATAARPAPDMSGVVEPGQRPNPGVDAGRDPGFAWKAAQPGMGDVQRASATGEAPSVGAMLGRAGQVVEEGLQAANEAVAPYNLPTRLANVVAGREQVRNENPELYRRIDELQNQVAAGDESVLPELQALIAQSKQLNLENPEEVARRSPDYERLQNTMLLGEGAIAMGIAPTLASGPVRNAIAAGIDPVGQVMGGGLEAAGRGIKILNAGETGAIGNVKNAKAAADAEFVAATGRQIQQADLPQGNITREGLAANNPRGAEALRLAEEAPPIKPPGVPTRTIDAVQQDIDKATNALMRTDQGTIHEGVLWGQLDDLMRERDALGAAPPPRPPVEPPTPPQLPAPAPGLNGGSAVATSAAHSTTQPPALPGQTPASGVVLSSRISPQSLPSSGSIAPQAANVTPPPRPPVKPPATPTTRKKRATYQPQGPPKEAGFREFWDRTRNVIADQGPAGKELAQKVYDSREFGERVAGGWVSAMPTVRTLGPHELDKFVDMAEGTRTSVDPVVVKAFNEWSAVREQIWNAADGAGIQVGKQQDYFPHIFEPDTFSDKQKFESAVRHLVSSGQAKNAAAAEQLMYRFKNAAYGKHGNLESARIADLPGYKRDKEALFGYVESAADRIGQALMFGPKYEQSAKLLGQIRKTGYDDQAAKHAFNVATGSQLYGEKAAKVSRAIRAYNVVTKMGLSLIANAGQSINTATVAGTMRTLRNMPDAFGDKAAADYALKIGVTLDGVLNDLREGAGFSGKFARKVGAPGFQAVERFNRTLAAAVGKEFATDAASKAAGGDAGAIKHLADMGLDGQSIAARGGQLTQGEIDTAARRIVERTQFKVDPQDLPVWADSPWGKLIMQFRSFSYNQSAFIGREVIAPALDGDVTPLMRFLILAPVVGAGTSELRNLIANRPSEEDPAKRIVQYYQKAGGLGIVGDLMTAFFPQNVQYLDPNRYTTMALGSVGGPTVSLASDVLGGGSAAVQGNPTNMERFALKQIPVVGSPLMNTLLPYKPGGRSATSGAEGSPVKSILEGRRRSSPVREFRNARSK